MIWSLESGRKPAVSAALRKSVFEGWAPLVGSQEVFVECLPSCCASYSLDPTRSAAVWATTHVEVEPWPTPPHWWL